MHDALANIVNILRNVTSQGERLAAVAREVKGRLGVDVCSVYLLAPTEASLVLEATDGLDPLAVGTMRFAQGEGLVGLVAERQSLISLSNAQEHPRFRHFPEFGEQAHYAFLGVPIVHDGVSIGVLAVRQLNDRRFNKDEEDFLSAVAAALSGLLDATLPLGPKASAGQEGRPAMPRSLHGVKGASGIGIGIGVLPLPAADLDAVPEGAAADAVAEARAFQQAVAAVRAELRSSGERMVAQMPTEVHAMFGVYIELLDDDELFAETLKRIRAGASGGSALRRTIAEHARAFEESPDPYLRARAEDLRGLGRRVLLHLQPGKVKREAYPEQCILVGEEVSIVRIADVPLGQLAGLVCTRGSPFSHAAILARTLRIPAVMGIGSVPLAQLGRQRLLVDGNEGRVFIDPAPEVVARFDRLIKKARESAAALSNLRNLPAETLDGARVALHANIGLPSDLATALDSGAEGIGLFRTEFTFMVREAFPSEDDQYRVYRNVLEAFAPRPVTIRTLDVGGDKGLPYFPMEETNPFLGWRGIRLTLDNPGIFLTQLRALLRANAGVGNLQILLPMISSTWEVDAVRELLARAAAESGVASGFDDTVKLGAMVEVPSALYQMDALAKRVDFFSIGTNDLTQYLLAVDRTNARVSSRFDSLHPAVIRAINEAVRAAHSSQRPISVCGEMAGDPASAVLLVGMGINALSMASASIPSVKRALRTFTQEQAQRLAAEAIAAEDPSAVHRLLRLAFADAGLSVDCP